MKSMPRKMWNKVKSSFCSLWSGYLFYHLKYRYIIIDHRNVVWAVRPAQGSDLTFWSASNIPTIGRMISRTKTTDGQLWHHTHIQIFCLVYKAPWGCSFIRNKTGSGPASWMVICSCGPTDHHNNAWQKNYKPSAMMQIQIISPMHSQPLRAHRIQNVVRIVMRLSKMCVCVFCE